MSRARPEWISTHDDQAIPRLVKARIWLREDGRCHLTGAKINPGDSYEWEHKIALACGGEHRESNICLALTEPHKAKTALDLNAAAKIKRIHAKHNGYWPAPKRKLEGRGFQAGRNRAFAPKDI
jgi:5-methylcytosine-specific restriction protein A